MIVGVSMASDRFDSLQLTYCAASGERVGTSLGRVAVEELVAAGPVRQFRWYKGRTFYSGWYWSSTTGAMVVYESRLELARILLADFDPSVRGIVAQPFLMRGQVGGRERSHVPDLLLSHADGSVTVVDVKPAHRLSDPKVVEVFDWTAAAVGVRGWAFETWSGTDPVLLENIRFLAGYRRRSVIDHRLSDAVVGLVGEQSTLGGVERAVEPAGPPQRVRPLLLHLLWAGVLATDLSLPLGAGSPVWRAQVEVG